MSARLETLPRTHVCIYIAHAPHTYTILGISANSKTLPRTRTRKESNPRLFSSAVLGNSPLDQWRYRSRLGNSSAVVVTVFRSLPMSSVTSVLQIPISAVWISSLPSAWNVALSSAQSARWLGSPRLLSSGSEVSASSALISSAPQISAPAAVNPSAWDFVGSGLGFGWDVLGSPLHMYTKSS